MNNLEHRRSLVCPEDGAENSPHALACLQCGRRLSRIEINGVFVQRYHILKSLGETKSGFRYLVQLAGRAAGNDLSLTLREVVPAADQQPGNRERLLRFDRAARHLTEARPGSLPPVHDHFTDGPCFYTVEAVPAGPRLLETIELTGSFAEAQANSLLAGLLAGLRELYSLDPPVYLGDLDAGKILLNSQKAPVFLEPGYLVDTVMKAEPPPAQEMFVQDLYASAYATVSALSGVAAPDPRRVSDTLARVKDLPFGCMLDWILHANGKKPESWQKIDQFRGLVVSAESAMKSGNTAKAVEFLGQAHDLSGSKLVEASLQKLDKPVAEKKVENSDKPRSSPVSPPIRLTVQPASSAAQPAVSLVAEQPPVSAISVEPANPTWTCVSCGTVSPFAAAFCTRCGRSQLRPEPRRRGKWTVIAIVAAMAALGAWAWYWFSGSLQRDFDAVLNREELVSPAGRSAYDLYKKAVASEGADSSLVREMNGKAMSRLHRLSDEQFTSWHDNSRLSGTDWTTLAKVEEWLAAMDAADSTSQARKKFADAQVSLLHNRFSEALAGFRSALRQLPHWDLAVAGIGRSCFAMQDYPCAEKYYTEARQLEPNWIWPHHNLMELYLAPARRNIPAACQEFQLLMDLSAPMSPPPFDRDALRQRMEKTCTALSLHPGQGAGRVGAAFS